MCIFFGILYAYESNTHRTISSNNDLNQNNDTQWHNNPIHSNNITNDASTTYTTKGTIQQHTEPCIQQHIERHTEQRIIPNDVPNNIHTTCHTSSVRQTKQQSTSGPIRDDLEQKTYKATGQTDS